MNETQINAPMSRYSSAPLTSETSGRLRFPRGASNVTISVGAGRYAEVGMTHLGRTFT